MTPFLKLVADDLYNRYNGKLDNVAVVFPNKRAGLFFNEYLLQKSGNKPMWSPQYLTINELFQQYSELAIGDTILLVSKLYKEYIPKKNDNESIEEYERRVESIDDFYYWGEMLIRDFDDIDKNLANAEKLFANIKDLREMGTAKDTLEKEQLEAINRFFKNFNPDKESDIKKKFQNIWERLFSIYTNFKEALRRENLAYEGMLYRDVIEKKDTLEFNYDKYLFVGFNALNGVETELFKILEKRGKALFYWDYDIHYTNAKHHEAGHFMRKNLEYFPNAIKCDNFNNIAQNKNVTVVSSSSDSIQARYLSQWLDGNLTKKEIETAIVLCDETMLEPVLHTIPKRANGYDLEYMNVTMGYPISNTPIYELVKLLVELQTRGWSKKMEAFNLVNVCNLLKHPYIIQGYEKSIELREMLLKNKKFYPTDKDLHLTPFLKKIFTRYEDNYEWLKSLSELIYEIACDIAIENEDKHELYSKLFSEATLKVYTQAQRLMPLIKAEELNMQQSTIGQLFIRMLASQSMPFHGEPVVGLQIMGLLETRNLDFKNIILLSANEGNIPKNSCENSFIPYNLRRAFGLTLSEHRDAIYAYYFYRLLQRAENVTLVYNNSTESKSRGECSRYILQLTGSNIYNINHLALSAEQGNDTISVKEVQKNESIMNVLYNCFDRNSNKEAQMLTPTAINRYIRCRLNFFYYYILKLKPQIEIDTEMQPSDFGNVFHKAAEKFYEKLTKNSNTVITSSVLEHYIDSPALLYEFVDDAFKDVFFKGNKPEYNGEQYINRGMIHRFLKRLLKIDKEYTPFRYVCGEQEIAMPYSLEHKGKKIDLLIGGTIDRVDVKGDTINIVDYKTGGGKKETKVSLDSIFSHESKSGNYRLQSLLYSTVLHELLSKKEVVMYRKKMEWVKKVKDMQATKISPSLLYIHKEDIYKKREDFIIDIMDKPVTDISENKKEYMEKLESILKDIFDPDLSFAPTDDKKRCEYCDYKNLCGK